MEFRTHTDEHGLMNGTNVEWHGPRAPGSLVVWRAVAIGIHDRAGLVVGVSPGRVDVVWNDWVKEDVGTMAPERHQWFVDRMNARRAEGRRRRKEAKVAKWEQRKRARAGLPSCPDTST